MGGCQNYGPFWGTLNNRCRIIVGTQKGTLILTTAHIGRKPKRWWRKLPRAKCRFCSCKLQIKVSGLGFGIQTLGPMGLGPLNLGNPSISQLL